MSVWTLFGGKGGVGKTTLAASWSVTRADDRARVLVVSTDPAHSLADALDKRLTKGKRTKVTRGLDALELDSSSAVTRWMKQRRPALSRLLDRGTLLDQHDIERVLALPLPGLDELAAFLAMAELEAAGEYDEVVIDTAPTGHTFRLLETPVLIQGAAALLGAMHDRHTMVAEALGGVVGADALVDELRDDAARVAARLHDAAQTRLFWVTLPEPVAVAETLDAIGWLRRGGFPLSGILVNRLTPLPGRGQGRGSCAECRTRAGYERAALAPLERAARAVRPPTPLHVVQAQPSEPRGLSALRKGGQSPLLKGKGGQSPFPTFPTRKNRRKSVTVAVSKRGTVPLFSAIRGTVPLSLLFFGGKGGVGKTTCAAAVALAIAARSPGRRVRLISTDPAPSLGDVLGMAVGDTWTRVPGSGQLEVRELDAARLFDDYRRRYRAAVEEFFNRLRGGSAFDAVADRAVFERLFELAPPGLDEIMALLTVVDLVQAGDDLLIVDTAPTGHTLRLLAAQDDLQRWAALLMQLMLKYQLAGRAESLARDLVKLSRDLRGFRELLTDPARARFMSVVRPAALPRLETARLLRELRILKIAAPLLIVNGETTGTCRECRRRARGEQTELAALRRLCRARTAACDIIHAPLHLPPPRGPRELLAWTSGWRHDGEH